jgi:glycosyltransferase involved in cell wall biosynthesis
VRILMPSIVDPSTFRGGAGTVTRALVRALERPPLAAEVEIVASPERRGARRRIRQIASLAGAALAGEPAKLRFQRSRSMLRRLERSLAERPPDLVLINGADHFWLLPHLPSGLPVAFVAHNVEHQLYRSQCERTTGGLGGLPRLVARDVERLRAAEIAAWRRIGRGLFLSPIDEAVARAACPGIETLVVPPLFDASPWDGRRAPPADDGVLELGVLGNFDWWPNRRGVDWLIREVLPRVDGGFRLHLYGRGGERWRGRDPRLRAHGHVDDLETFWRRCDLALVPAFDGGGVVIKLAEALYHRKPVVATTFAARGAGVVAGAGVAVLDDAGGWAELLGGEDARGLAARRPPPAQALRFALATHLPALHAFVHGAAEAEPHGPAGSSRGVRGF